MRMIDHRRDAIGTVWPPRDIRRPDAEISLVHLLAIVFSRLDHWFELRRSRRALRTLSDDMLRDVGLTRNEARAEASRSLHWD